MICALRAHRGIGLGGLILVVGLVVLFVWLFAVRDRGPAPDSAANLRAALHPLAVATTERDLARAVVDGAPRGRLLVLTNELADLIRSDATATRRANVDEALRILAEADCPLCEETLQRIR